MPYCGRCGSLYARKDKWLKHYELEHLLQPSISKGYIPNPCFQQPSHHPRIFHNNRDEAKRLYNSALKAFSGFRSPGASNKRQCTEKENSDNESEVAAEGTSNDGLDSPMDIDSGEVVTESDVDVVTPESTIVDLNSVSAENMREISCKILEEFHKITEKLDKQHTEICSKVDENYNDMSSKLNTLKLSSQDKSQPTLSQDLYTLDPDDSYTAAMVMLKDSKSVTEIMDNPLIRDVFIMHKNHESENGDEELDTKIGKLICKPCTDNIVTASKKHARSHSFQVSDVEYKCLPKSGGIKPWFSNLKRSVKDHLRKLEHHQNVAAYKMLTTRSLAKREDIRKICAEIMYYILVTNTAFRLYPVLLAVTSKCGLEVGNINHTRTSITTVSPWQLILLT